MGSLSNYAESKILDHTFKNTAFTQPTNLYLALLKSTPDDTHTGSDLPGEFSGDGYERKKCNTWDAAGGAGATENSQPCEFAQATGDWGLATHFAVCDKTTLGNVIGWSVLDVSKNIQSGDQARFATGDLDVTLD